ncbi:MAG: hypothetical protein AABX01_02830 [Candidatus Micrarchaeota archaeon]
MKKSLRNGVQVVVDAAREAIYMSGKKDEEFDYGEGLNSIMGGLGYLFVLLGLFALIAGIWKHLSGEFSLYYFGFGFGLLLVGASLTTAGAVSRIERKYVGD